MDFRWKLKPKYYMSYYYVAFIILPYEIMITTNYTISYLKEVVGFFTSLGIFLNSDSRLPPGNNTKYKNITENLNAYH